MGFLHTVLPEYYNKETIFVETGTYLGGGIDYALSFPFKRMASCELLKNYYDLAKIKYNSVELYHSNSIDFLKDILPTISKDDRIVFWLDAHYPGLYSDVKIEDIDTIFPLERELEIIYGHRKDCKDLILCDDLRIYTQASFHGGNIETPLQKDSISQFPAFTMWKQTHDIIDDLRDEGYLIFRSKNET